MADKKSTPDIGTRVILFLGVITLVVALTTIVLWALGQHVAAAIVGTATLFSFLSLGGIVLLAIGSWWSAALMERGGQLVLAAQISDDKRDGILINQVGALTRDVLRLVQGERSAPPPLPVDWLPETKYLEPPGNIST